MPEAQVNPLPAIAVINGYQLVPIADSPDNVVMRDVVGNKTDTVAGNSIVSLVKIVDELHDVPLADSALNAQINEVVGNKTDTVAGNSAIALLKQIEGTGFATGTDSLKVLSDMLDTIRTELTFQQQPDATISQVNPVSTTLYPVLPTTTNVRIIGIETDITWAVTQPTPLEIVVTIDGQSFIWVATNPVSATQYFAPTDMANSETFQQLQNNDRGTYRAFLFEGRSIKIDARITWGITQPTPLNVRVRFAKR